MKERSRNRKNDLIRNENKIDGVFAVCWQWSAQQCGPRYVIILDVPTLHASIQNRLIHYTHNATHASVRACAERMSLIALITEQNNEIDKQKMVGNQCLMASNQSYRHWCMCNQNASFAGHHYRCVLYQRRSIFQPEINKSYRNYPIVGFIHVDDHNRFV